MQRLVDGRKVTYRPRRLTGIAKLLNAAEMQARVAARERMLDEAVRRVFAKFETNPPLRIQSCRAWGRRALADGTAEFHAFAKYFSSDIRAEFRRLQAKAA